MRKRAKVSGSLANVRALAQGVHLYANDNGGRFPKWSTSGGSEGWFLTLRPYVEGEGVSAWVHPAFADPLDERPPPSSTTNHQIGWKLSVITTQGHASAPGGAARSAEPRLLTEIKDPANTILFAPNMWHTRESWQNADQIQSLFDRLNGKATYAFIDGHAELLALEETYDPAQGIDRWSDQ